MCVWPEQASGGVFSVSYLCVSVSRRLRRKSHVQLFKQICVSFWCSEERFTAHRLGDWMKVSNLSQIFPLNRSNKNRLKSPFDLDLISLLSRRISWDLICDASFLLVMMCCCWTLKPDHQLPIETKLHSKTQVDKPLHHKTWWLCGRKMSVSYYNTKTNERNQLHFA